MLASNVQSPEPQDECGGIGLCDSSIQEVEVTEPEVQGHPLEQSLKPAWARDPRQRELGGLTKNPIFRVDKSTEAGMGRKAFSKVLGSRDFRFPREVCH